MQTARTHNQHASTYLTHIFGSGLADNRFVVERFQSLADGEIRPYASDGRSKGGRKQPRKVMSLRAVQRLRPERNEIIIATGVEIAGGVQMWGDQATHLFIDGKRR